MAGDNVTLNTGTGGDTVRTKDRSGTETQIVGLDLTIGGGSETLMNGSIPVTDNSGSLTVDAPVGTPVFVRLSDGSSAIATLPVSLASLPATAADGAALPAVVVAVGGFDGTNLQALVTDSTGRLVLAPTTQAGATVKTSDYDTGAGTDTVPMQGLALPASGGAVQGGTSTNPVRTDPTGTTAQPITDNGGSITVDGTVTANLGTAAVTNAGTFAVQIAANSSVNQAQIAGTTTDTNSGNKSAGTQRVVLATDQPALTNALKVDGSAVTQPVSGTLTANLAAAAGAAGLSKFHLVSAATTNATNLKASAGKVHGWYIYNSNTAARKVAFHNTAGTPTAGSGVTDSIVIPPTSAANVFTETGIAFSTGIAITTVTDLTDAGTTAVAANDLIINIYFI